MFPPKPLHLEAFLSPRPGRLCPALALALLALAGLAGLAGCASDTSFRPSNPSAPLYNGPAYLQGTVGSLTSLQHYAPLLVSGYGLVVNLPGTGSSEVPSFLRDWLIKDMRAKGLGSYRMGTQNDRPEAILASTRTAVVEVEGMIPAGATKGDSFDVLVTALPQTQTTNLEGGTLVAVDMTINGNNPHLIMEHVQAVSKGPMYVHPFDNLSDARLQIDQQRQGIVVAGGVVKEDRYITLVLNQPSWTRSADIGRRINERFQESVNQEDLVAFPKNDSVIQLRVPRRFHGKTDEFIDLVSHLFTQRTPTFEIDEARVLGELLLANPEYERHIVLCWESLGKTALPTIRGYYQNPKTYVRLAALQAGAKLQDMTTADDLLALSTDPDPAIRTRVAKILSYLPASLRTTRILLAMLNDHDQQVRIDAYEVLSARNDGSIHRTVFADDKQLNFALELVPSDKPLIYVAEDRYPRVVIFAPEAAAFKAPARCQLWDSQLMIRVPDDNKPATVFYQGYMETQGRTFSVLPLVANFVYLLGNQPTPDSQTPGLDLSFSRVINALHALSSAGQLNAPLELNESRLAAKIAELRQQDQTGSRPESDLGQESAIPPPPASPENTGSLPPPASPPAGVSAGQNHTPASSSSAPIVP